MGSVQRTGGSSAPAGEQEGTLSPVRSSSSPCLLLSSSWHKLYTHLNDRATALRWSLPPREARGDTVRYLFRYRARAWQSTTADKLRLDPDSPDLFDSGNRHQNTREKDSCPASPCFDFLSVFSFAIYFLLPKNQEHGRLLLLLLLRGWKKTRFVIALRGCFTGFISLWRKGDRRSGAAR